MVSSGLLRRENLKSYRVGLVTRKYQRRISLYSGRPVIYGTLSFSEADSRSIGQ
jgi:hypothetical protein